MEPDKLLDIAFRQANQAASQKKKSKKVRKDRRHIEADLERLKVTYNTINSFIMEQMEKSSTSELMDFDKALIDTLVDLKKMKEDIKKMQQTLRILKRLRNEYEMKIKYSDDKDQSNKFRTAFYGRVSSLVKKLKFTRIESYEKEKQTLPQIKNMNTVIVAGYPNVGKSLLVKNLSGHKVNVQSYPFTTKELLIGYMPNRYDKVQIIDTPGILDRPLEKRNKIEIKAVLALKYVSKNIVFVIDPTETCGYSLEEQENLLKEVKKLLGAKIMVIETKKDINTERKKIKSDLEISNSSKSDIKKAHDSIIKFFF